MVESRINLSVVALVLVLVALGIVLVKFGVNIRSEYTFFDAFDYFDQSKWMVQLYNVGESYTWNVVNGRLVMLLDEGTDLRFVAKLQRDLGYLEVNGIEFVVANGTYDVPPSVFTAWTVDNTVKFLHVDVNNVQLDFYYSFSGSCVRGNYIDCSGVVSVYFIYNNVAGARVELFSSPAVVKLSGSTVLSYTTVYINYIRFYVHSDRVSFYHQEIVNGELKSGWCDIVFGSVTRGIHGFYLGGKNTGVSTFDTSIQQLHGSTYYYDYTFAYYIYYDQVGGYNLSSVSTTTTTNTLTTAPSATTTTSAPSTPIPTTATTPATTHIIITVVPTSTPSTTTTTPASTESQAEKTIPMSLIILFIFVLLVVAVRKRSHLPDQTY